MGQTLSQPITDKHSSSGADDRYLYAVSEMQGWRISMEDAHTTVLRLNDDDPNTFFAVYDGHGGASVARYSGRNVHKRLLTEESYADKSYERALKQAFLGTDEDMRADPSFMHDPAGCTAVAALIADGTIYVANAGDSRSVLSLKGTAKPLSFDHKPQNELETKRIKAAGGYIEYGRVNGNLALSRALGDFEFKKNYTLAPEKQIITADPDVTEHRITEEDEFFVLACDGIWDCLSSQQVINIVRRQVAEKKELEEICENILDRCLALDSGIQGGIGCDNMTVIIVAMLAGRTKEEWYDWVGERVARNHGFATPVGLPEIYPHHRQQSQPSQGWTSRGAQNGGSAYGRGIGGGIAFYPGVGLFEESSMYQEYEDSSGDELDGDADEDVHAAIEEMEVEDGMAKFKEPPEGKLAELVSPSGAHDPWRSEDGEDDGDSTMTETSEVEEQHPHRPQIVTDGVADASHTSEVPTPEAAMLGSQGKCVAVGSPLVPSPEPLALLAKTDGAP